MTPIDHVSELHKIVALGCVIRAFGSNYEAKCIYKHNVYLTFYDQGLNSKSFVRTINI